MKMIVSSRGGVIVKDAPAIAFDWPASVPQGATVSVRGRPVNMQPGWRVVEWGDGDVDDETGEVLPTGKLPPGWSVSQSGVVSGRVTGPPESSFSFNIWMLVEF